MKIPKILKLIAAEIEKAGGKPFLVGGAVRDHLMERKSKDLDVEVFGLSLTQLRKTLGKFGYVRQVGKAFGILKLFAGKEDFDFSLPRKDVKTGAGHKGFRISTDPFMSFKKAASRRDFTINAMGMDILNGRIMDEFGGREDLENKILRVVDPDTFAEDPLRVLRGVQFAARFQLDVTPDSLRLFRRLSHSLKELPKERIFDEMKKLLLKAQKPSSGFRLASLAGVNAALFPDLQALLEVPDGKDWNRAMRTIDEAAGLRSGDQFRDTCLMLAAVCCRLNKKNSVESARLFMEGLTAEIKLTNTVLSLVKERDRPSSLHQAPQVQDGAIRRLSLEADVGLLLKLAKADYLGGGGSDGEDRRFPAGEWIEKRLRSLGLKDRGKIVPLLMGRHLIKLGLKPSPSFGRILKEAFELQLDGLISNEAQAIEWARQKIEDRSGIT